MGRAPWPSYSTLVEMAAFASENIEAWDGPEEISRGLFIDFRWPDGPECPYCLSKKVWALQKKQSFKCKACHGHFSETTGTIFHRRKMAYSTIFCMIMVYIQSRARVERAGGEFTPSLFQAHFEGMAGHTYQDWHRRFSFVAATNP